MRSHRQIKDLNLFQDFLRLLGSRNGQPLSLTSMAKYLGVEVNTVKAWLCILEDSLQGFVLRPYCVKTGKRPVKTPKIYFLDVGTLCHLLGIRDPEHAARIVTPVQLLALKNS